MLIFVKVNIMVLKQLFGLPMTPRKHINGKIARTENNLPKWTIYKTK